jgi:ferredoxin
MLHFSQVIPIEDTIKILSKMSSIIKLPCSCRKYYGEKCERCCLGITLDPIKVSYAEDINREMFDNPNMNNLEFLTVKEAVDLVNGYEKRGLIHTVWTLKSPVIVAICNCIPESCMGFQLQEQGLRTMFKAEYVAVINNEACVGCRACLEKCHLGAMHYNSNTKKVIIDAAKCYGCGACRVACHKGAISLMERKSHTDVKNLWF